MMKLAVQTFTVRKDLGTPKKIIQSYERLNSMGVKSVELARINFKQNEINAVAEACSRFGMSVGSTQITFDFLQKNFEQLVNFHKQLNCNIASVSVLPTKYIINDGENWPGFYKELNLLGERYKNEGIDLLYHHHHFEFRKYKGKTGIEILLENTDAENIGLVCDTYWTQRGGMCPADFIANPENRVKAVHLRDYKIHWKYFDLLPMDAEIGEGNLNVKKIMDACILSNVAYAAIEQESKLPWDSLQTSVNNLKKMGFENYF
jgi:sugar phosphate isomerase/epimerase